MIIRDRVECRRVKYLVQREFSYNTGLGGHTVERSLVTLAPDGRLTVRPGYLYDGPSGPTLDTPDFMTGALVHDVLYDLIRRGSLPAELRRDADDLLWEICRADGMSWLRALYVWWAVRRFGGRHAAA